MSQLNYKTDECPLCKRELGERIDKPPLIPKAHKGKDVVWIHKICHRAIHAILTEKELQKYYHTPDRLLEHEEIVKFVKWVSKKHIDFYQSMKESKASKGKVFKSKKDMNKYLKAL